MKRHVASLTMLAITIVAMIVLAFIETPTLKTSLPLVCFTVGSFIAIVIHYEEEQRCGRHVPQFVGSTVPKPTVREFRWGVPLVGPQDGPPCNECGTATIVAYGPCTSLYWCAKCKKNVIPGLAPPRTITAA